MCTHSIIAQKLYFLASSNQEMELFPEAFSFWDSIDLAKDGVYGDVEEQNQYLMNFLVAEKT